MKEKLKSILGNGLPWGLAIFGLGCIVGYQFKIGTSTTLKSSAIVAVATLFASGSLYRRFQKPVKDLENLHIELEEHEQLVLQVPANHLIDESLVPGKVVLTDRRIIFKPFEVKDDIQPLYIWQLRRLNRLHFTSQSGLQAGTFY